jgi:hypothetical protein
MRFEGGVLDAGRGIVFVATERATGAGDRLETAVEAIDVATGKLRWRTPGAGLPVAILGTHVLVAHWRPGGSSLAVSLLDGGDGRVAAKNALPLPSWTAQPGASVAVEAAWTDEDGSVSVLWHGVSVYAGGAAPPQWVVDEQTRDVRGVFLFDPAGGTAREVAAASLTPPPTPAPQLAPATRPDGEQPVGVVGDVLLTLHLEPAEGSVLPSGSTTLTLKARDSTDSVLWSYQLRDVIWHRPPPLPQ